ncbi:hypothetical protein [uncultured Chryseobacterium sp.]|uniref:hypothetical protein n=1 Tax=uncultured Chryseobacterium sp. TaxID=259322 RepID=UPI00258C9AA5|nr:hypothetical protein [uncultured Chryseobacterium sp.]
MAPAILARIVAASFFGVESIGWGAGGSGGGWRAEGGGRTWNKKDTAESRI